MAKSKQQKTEDQKTISIIETRKLRLQVVRPNKGIVELVNSADHGRVCTLSTDDFQSVNDALVYAELLRLAPELLDNYLSDTKRLKEVVERLEKNVVRAKRKKPNAKK